MRHFSRLGGPSREIPGHRTYVVPREQPRPIVQQVRVRRLGELFEDRVVILGEHQLHGPCHSVGNHPQESLTQALGRPPLVVLIVLCPERLYQAVAVVLAYIYRVDKGEDLERPEVELPEDLKFNEHGNLMSGETNA